MSTIFTKIINREIPAHILAEEDEFIAILDINPLVKGHALVICKQEVDQLFELPYGKVGRMMDFASKVADVLKQNVKCNRVGVIVSGFEMPHAHMHLMPANSTSDLNLSNPKLSISKEEFIEFTTKFRESYAFINGNSKI